MPRPRSPPRTNAAAPVGPLMFRRLPFVRDMAIDSGEATASRLSRRHVLPSLTGNRLGLRDLPPFEARSHTPHDPCLRFRPRIAATPARLGSDLPATALVG